jgi:hypothetical protein
VAAVQDGEEERIVSLWSRAALFFGTLFGLGCAGIAYQDTVTPDGLTNLHVLAPGVIRVGRPTTVAQWVSLHERLMAMPGDDTLPPLFVQLHFDYEADDAPFAQATGFALVKMPLYPEDGKVWTVVESSSPQDVMRAVNVIVSAHQIGRRVAFGCMHDRDRGGVVAALVGMKILGWSESQAWDYMQQTGSRIEVLPGLLESWLATAP